MGKVLVCRCEDVLLTDLEAAIDAGHLDVESLKRYTGFGTGVCQGKSCVAHVAGILIHRTGMSPDLIAPFTPRPPLAPIPLALLAAPDEEEGPGE